MLWKGEGRDGGVVEVDDRGCRVDVKAFVINPRLYEVLGQVRLGNSCACWRGIVSERKGLW